MTNEEAKKIIFNQWQSFLEHNIDYGGISEAYKMAIKALEQQQNVHDTCKKCVEFSEFEQKPCEDCVSRQSVINTIFYNSDNSCDVVLSTNLMDRINSLPSVTPQTRWIPVSERLPKENEYIGNVCKYYLIQDEYGDMHVAHLSNAGWRPMDSFEVIGNEVIAWMPLPQPYNVESEDE